MLRLYVYSMSSENSTPSKWYEAQNFDIEKSYMPSSASAALFFSIVSVWSQLSKNARRTRQGKSFCFMNNEFDCSSHTIDMSQSVAEKKILLTMHRGARL